MLYIYIIMNDVMVINFENYINMLCQSLCKYIKEYVLFNLMRELERAIEKV